MKFRLREKFTSEIFYLRKYPDLRYLILSHDAYSVMFERAPPLKKETHKHTSTVIPADSEIQCVST